MGEVLQDICAGYPALREKLFEGPAAMKKTMNLYLNKEDIRYLGGLDEPVSETDELIILPPASGG